MSDPIREFFEAARDFDDWLKAAPRQNDEEFRTKWRELFCDKLGEARAHDEAAQVLEQLLSVVEPGKSLRETL